MSLFELAGIESLGWVLLHFVWQGAGVFLALWLTLAMIRRCSAQLQYLVLCGGMVLMAIFPVATLFYVWPSATAETPSPPAIRPPQIEPARDEITNAVEPIHLEVDSVEWAELDLKVPPVALVPPPSTPFDQSASGRTGWWVALQSALPWLVLCWLIGVSTLSLRLVFLFRQVRRLRHQATQPVPTIWQDRLAGLARSMGILRSVALVESALVEVPTVIGWLKPVILLPATALTGLNATQLESLLAHELAHVRRHDYLVNLVQTVVETLLFYHPAVWWLSRRIREIREVCCDEMAVSTCGNRLDYAKALATMEELRVKRSFAMAADGGSLPSRIRRIVAVSQTSQLANRKAKVPSGPAILLLGSLCTVAVSIFSAPWPLATTESQAVAGDVEDPVSSDADETDRGDMVWTSLLAKLRKQESRYDSYRASLKITRKFRPIAGRGGAMLEGGEAPLSETTSLAQQTVQGEGFRFLGQDLVARTSGEPEISRRQVTFDGRKTVAIEEGNSVAIYEGRAEPPQMLPPHCWGMFHLEVNFPLSVYLTGSDAIRSNPKAGRHPREAGSVYEFYRVEAEIAGEEIVDGLDCIIVLVKRWYYSKDRPVHQYLWLAQERNYHVAQTRTAFLRGGREVPREESRVTKWRQLADDLWLPQVVDVVEISPEAVANETTDTVVRRLMSVAELSAPAEAHFELPELPDGLPVFRLDSQRKLVSGPQHPVPLEPAKSTNLTEILTRLSDEEEKYRSCEASLEQRYVFLNRTGGMGSEVLESYLTQRHVVQVGREYFESEKESTSRSGKSVSSQVRGDDGSVLRSFDLYSSSRSNQAHARIDFARAKGQNRLHDAWLFSLPRQLAGYLKSGWYDSRRSNRMTVEYVGDERIWELVCHKLKCNLEHDYFYLWLARDRNLLPVRHEWHAPGWHASLPTGVQFVGEFQVLAPNVWFPRRVVELAFQKTSREGLVASRLVLQWRKDTTIDRIALNPVVNAKLFSEIVVPQGTQVGVVDHLSRRLGRFESAGGLLDVTPAKFKELEQQAAAKRNLTADKPPQEMNVAKRPPSRKRGDSDVGRLLDRLEQLNRPPTLFKDSWLRTLKEIVELGPDAVPELIEELDATDEDRMLRCLGFVLRAMNDNRAIPGLIRAIPKTLRRPGSDMGLTAFDPELMRFGKRHDLSEDDNQEHYGFGRPIREIAGALRQLTGREFGEESLNRLFLSGNPPARRGKRAKYFEVARSWASWWDENWEAFVDDEVYAKANLPPLQLSTRLRPDVAVKTMGKKNGLLLESLQNPDSTHVFYDLDSDTYGAPPDKWRSFEVSREIPAELVEWAAEQGFDLMGTRVAQPGDGELAVVLRGVQLDAWELDPESWKRSLNGSTLDAIRKAGRPIRGALVRRDRQAPINAEAESKVSFLVTTSEGLPVLLHVGVEVRDASQKPGTFYLGDPELNPTGTKRGRRFGVTYLEAVKPPR